MRQNVRTCFMLWIQHQTTQTPIAISQSTHDNRCLVFFSVTSLKFLNVYSICNMEKAKGGVKKNDLWLTILTSIFSFSLWKMQKSVRGNSPRRENPIANQLYCSLMPFFTWKKTFFSGQSTIHVNLTFSTGSKVTWCIWFGDTSGKKIESKMSEIYHLNDIIIVKKRFTFCGFMNYLWTQWELKHIGKVWDEEISFFCFLFPLRLLEAFFLHFNKLNRKNIVAKYIFSLSHRF